MKKAILVLFVLVFFAASANAQSGKMYVGGQVGISLPMGDFSDAYNMGFGFLGNFYYGINQNIELTGSLGYLHWGLDAEGADGGFSDVPLLAGARYYFQRSAFTPYALAELGLHFRSFSFEVPFFGTIDESDTEFGLGFGAGFLYDLGAMQLDVNAKINIISDQNHITLLGGLRFPI